MRPYRVVVLSPVFDEHLVRRAINALDRLLTRLTLQCVENFSVQKLVAELSVKGLVISVLPGASRFDEQRLHADPAEPGSDDFGRELRAVIGTDVIRPSLDFESNLKNGIVRGERSETWRDVLEEIGRITRKRFSL